MKFFSSIGRFFKKIFTTTTWTHQAAATLTLTAPLIETLVTVFAGAPVGNATTAVLNEIQSDFGVVVTTLHQAQDGALSGPQLALVSSTLNAIKNNLADLEKASHISNPDTLEKINVTVTAVTAEIDAIIGLIPQTPAK